MFVKATKAQSKLRLGLVGPSGSGKTYTALSIASGLGNRVAVIDTEFGSASLYADKFDFDVTGLMTFSPERYVAAIHEAEQHGYNVIIIDSLTHAWTGEGGALEMANNATLRSKSGNSYMAWREVTPVHNALVSAMLQSPAHIICTMRSKTEYVIENVNGKSTPKKIGMAPIQRDGMEYEFTLCADLDLEHNLIISKTRYDALDGAVIKKPGKEFGTKLLSWLMSGSPSVPPDAISEASAKTAKISTQLTPLSESIEQKSEPTVPCGQALEALAEPGTQQAPATVSRPLTLDEQRQLFKGCMALGAKGAIMKDWVDKNGPLTTENVEIFKAAFLRKIS